MLANKKKNSFPFDIQNVINIAITKIFNNKTNFVIVSFEPSSTKLGYSTSYKYYTGPLFSRILLVTIIL